MVLISGHDGGTGASPMTSLKHAGTPWEVGLAETQQTLLLNGLRDRITVQVDGAMKTGRDVVVAALLGAEEYGFATAPLVVAGCVMMRVCHLDTCPVGVATQNPDAAQALHRPGRARGELLPLRRQGSAGTLAQLGFRTLDEAIGRTEVLDTDEAVEHWKAQGLDLGAGVRDAGRTPVRRGEAQGARPGPRAGVRPRPHADPAGGGGAGGRAPGASWNCRCAT